MTESTPMPLPPELADFSPPGAGFAPLTEGDHRTLIDQVPAAVFVVQDGRMRYANAKLGAVFGFTPAELAERDPYLLTAAPDRDVARRHAQRRMDGIDAAGTTYDIRCVRKDGSGIDVRVSGARVVIDGRPASVVTMHDVSELRQATVAAEQRSQLLAQTEALARLGSSAYDVATGEVTQSAGMFRIFGEVPTDGRVDGEWLMCRVPAADQALVRHRLEQVRPNEPCEFEHRIVHADGTLRTVLHRAVADADAHGVTTRVVGIVQDVTAQRLAEASLQRLADTDAPTGLPNRTALLDRLADVAARARSGGGAGLLLLLQIAQFKLVSEAIGHAGGDALLAAVAGRLAHAGLAHDTLAHLGGGEYAAIYGDPADAAAVPHEARAAAVFDALTAPFTIGGLEVHVTCAIGVDRFPGHDDAAGAILRQAEAALRLAQDQGDHIACAYRHEHHGRSASRLAMEAGLRRALAHGEFHLLYQPQLDLATGGVVGVEALLRWTDPAHGLVSPVDFIPLAEASGLIVPIGEWVLRTACEQALAWQRDGLPPVRVSVNLSMRQLQRPDIASRIHTILFETGLDPTHLGLEITESMLIGESAHVIQVLGELKALGIEISLDDFGTGYSNLSYLRRLPIDVVKVDRTLVHDVTAAPQDISMTRAVIRIAHSLQMKVLAEGVETEGQLALLIANGCDQMQGYFFSRPVAAAAVAEILREGRRLPAHLLQQRAQARTLLIVDDEENVVASLKRLLRREGYRIVTAGSGAEGLRRLAEGPVDVIVSDQRMPGMTGVEFLRSAKELYPETVRIVLSGYTELQSITDAINEGAIYKFLTKPWDDDLLRGHIAEAFRHKELGDENRRLSDAVQAANHELAQVNDRLQRLLAEQRDKSDRSSNSLSVARAWLEHLPAPLIGIDVDGTIAFANSDAETLFAASQPLLGRDAHDVLPPALLEVGRGVGPGRRPSTPSQGVLIDGRPYLAMSRVLESGAFSQGRLLVLTPTAVEPTAKSGSPAAEHNVELAL